MIVRVTNRAAAESAMRCLALGDAFGETWLPRPAATVQADLEQRALPAARGRGRGPTTPRWCAAAHLDELAEALWATVLPGGDTDTTCAIVGGIIAGRTGLTGVAADWATRCEPLPSWRSGQQRRPALPS
jgi:hypothetical protein